MLNNGIEDFSIRPRRTALRDAIDAVSGGRVGEIMADKA
jgi:hypothetical protein